VLLGAIPSIIPTKRVQKHDKENTRDSTRNKKPRLRSPIDLTEADDINKVDAHDGRAGAPTMSKSTKPSLHTQRHSIVQHPHMARAALITASVTTAPTAATVTADISVPPTLAPTTTKLASVPATGACGSVQVQVADIGPLQTVVEADVPLVEKALDGPSLQSPTTPSTEVDGNTLVAVSFCQQFRS